MTISTHVLDTVRGRPAPGLRIDLERRSDTAAWRHLGATTTDDDGRAPDLVDDGIVVVAGQYRLTFDTGGWFAERGVSSFYPVVHVVFEIADADQHHHVPLLLSPFGYSTYRGS